MKTFKYLILALIFVLTAFQVEAASAPKKYQKSAQYRPLIAQLKNKLQQRRSNLKRQTKLLKFTISPAQPKVTEQVTIFIQPLTGVSDSDTLLTAQLGANDITANLEQPATELWVYDAGSFTEVRRHEMTVQVFLRDKHAAKLILDAIAVLDTAIADLNEQIANETDPDIIADLTAQRDDKIAQKDELVLVLADMNTQIAEESFSFNIAADPSLPDYPKITSITPNVVKAGVATAAVISGDNFGASPVVKIGSATVSSSVEVDGIHITTPELSPGPHAVRIRVMDGGVPKNTILQNAIFATSGDVSNPATPPTAFAEAVADPVTWGSSVEVTGANSFDSNGRGLGYAWSFVSVPDGAYMPGAGGVVDTSQAYTFSPTAPGQYVLKLHVHQTEAPSLVSSASLVVVTVQAPVNSNPAISFVNMQVATEGTRTQQLLNFDPEIWQRVSYHVVAQGMLGTATVDANGVLTYEAGAVAGTDTVTVLAVDNGTPPKSHTISITVNVSDTNLPPVVGTVATVELNENLPVSVNFAINSASDPDGNIVSVRYDFGDGTSEYSDQYMLVTHNYVAYGTYNGTVTVTDNHGVSTSENFTVTVSNTDQPVARFSLDKYTCAAPCTVTADATASTDADGITEYRWRWGNVAEVLGTDTESYTFNSNGTYRIRLRVRDANGVQGEGSATVYVGGGPPTGSPSSNDFKISPARENLVNTLITFDGTLAFDPNPSGAITEYSWNFGCMQPGCIVYDTADTVQFQYSEPTNYFPSMMTVNALGGQSYMPQLPWREVMNVTEGHGPRPIIRVNGSDIIGSSVGGVGSVALNLDASDSYDYDGSIASYEWDFGDGTFNTGVRQRKIYSTPGTYFVTLKTTDDDGNYPRRSMMVQVLPSYMKKDFTKKPLRARSQNADPDQKPYLIQACGAGNGQACYALAQIYQQEGDSFTAGNLMQRACSLGFAPACSQRRR